MFLSTREEATRAAVWERLRTQKTLARRGQAAITPERVLRSSLVYEGRAVGALCATRAQASRQALRREQDLLLDIARRTKGPLERCEKIMRAALVPQERPQPPDTGPLERRAHELAYFPYTAGVIGVRWRQATVLPSQDAGQGARTWILPRECLPRFLKAP